MFESKSMDIDNKINFSTEPKLGLESSSPLSNNQIKIISEPLNSTNAFITAKVVKEKADDISRADLTSDKNCNIIYKENERKSTKNQNHHTIEKTRKGHSVTRSNSRAKEIKKIKS